MGKPYKCIEGGELSLMGGSWFASYCAYDANVRHANKVLLNVSLPPNSVNWQNTPSNPKSRVYRFKKTQLWVLMPNGIVNKNSVTMSARKVLVRQGGIPLHWYWATWILSHSSKIMSPILGLSTFQVHGLLWGSIPFL